MNWGTKIVMLYVAFISMILLMVFKTTGQHIELVADDYYEQELQYEKKITALKNAKELLKPITVEKKGKGITIYFPQEMEASNSTGTITFFRPSAINLDLSFPLQVDSNSQQIIASDKLKRGLYKLSIDWSMNNKQYRFEEEIIMN